MPACATAASAEPPSPGGPSRRRTLLMPFKVEDDVRTEELFAEMFDQSWRYLAENFYDDKFHGPTGTRSARRSTARWSGTSP